MAYARSLLRSFPILRSQRIGDAGERLVVRDQDRGGGDGLGGDHHVERRERSSWPLLMSNCAPDRLRRLSVDADKCPSHVFRVTEPDRLRDAFDRFDSRLYPASG